MREINVLVLWHYLDRRGLVTSASITEFIGTISELQEMIKESDEKNRDNINPRPVPHQIIPFPSH